MDAVSIMLAATPGIIGAAIAWGTMGARVASHVKKLEEHEQRINKLKDDLIDQMSKRHALELENENKRHAMEIEGERVKTRVAVLEKDVDERAVAIDKLEVTFTRETRDQNKILMQLARSSRSVSQEMRQVDRPPSDPPELPPMRRRLPSQRSGE